MAQSSKYAAGYESSSALVIGIDKYEHLSPLGYARNDAEAVAEVLTSKFSFDSDRVSIFLDSEATRTNIQHRFLEYADQLSDNDRLLAFFAGHGHTRQAKRGDVGYLVPVDGDTSDLSSLVRWDEFTRNADLIPAKHVLFIIDACFSGLAIFRAARSGSMRFLKDMFQRYARQVLTAGKADEVVADSGGPRPDHSVFTGHLLDALDGAVEVEGGVISANAVMAYVYDRVSKDPQSRQTPHFGFLDGDGDFMFAYPALEALETADSGQSTDVLVALPEGYQEPDGRPSDSALPRMLKEYISEPRQAIQLDDLVMAEVRVHAATVQGDVLAPSAGVSDEEFSKRLATYESATQRLLVAAILLGRWGSEEHRTTCERMISRISDAIDPMAGGKTAWLGLRWFPLAQLMYGGGIAALSAGRYETLLALLATKIGPRPSVPEHEGAVVHVIHGLGDVKDGGMFARIPGYERNFVPVSEYLLKQLQPPLEDLLFLGKSYEQFFDRYEVFQALVYADATHSEDDRVWGPSGRYSWKRLRGRGGDPLQQVIEEAKQARQSWPPLRAGMFRGDYAHFERLSAGLATMTSQLSWR